MTARASVITDWRVRDESDLPDVLPGDEYERVITPQKHIVLQRILVHDLTLVRLQIGATLFDFELAPSNGPTRIYRPVIPRQLRWRCADEIAVVPGVDVRITLRNETGASAKPRAALLVQEKT